MTRLAIFRGPPGSGKSYAARRLYPNHTLVEADQFFVGDDGVYRYDPKRTCEAHVWCQATVIRLLCGGHDVAVANTFTRAWELAPYLALADGLGAEVVIHKCKGRYPNVHNVPAEVVARMRAEYEPSGLDERAV